MHRILLAVLEKLNALRYVLTVDQVEQNARRVGIRK